MLVFRGIADKPDDQNTCNDTLTLASARGTCSAIEGNPSNAAAIMPAGKITGLCRGQAYVASVPASYTNVVWFKNGEVVEGNTLTIRLLRIGGIRRIIFL